MTQNGRAWNAIMQYSFLHVFANEGSIDAQELTMFEKQSVTAEV